MLLLGLDDELLLLTVVVVGGFARDSLLSLVAKLLIFVLEHNF